MERIQVKSGKKLRLSLSGQRKNLRSIPQEEEDTGSGGDTTVAKGKTKPPPRIRVKIISEIHESLPNPSDKNEKDSSLSNGTDCGFAKAQRTKEVVGVTDAADTAFTESHVSPKNNASTEMKLEDSENNLLNGIDFISTSTSNSNSRTVSFVAEDTETNSSDLVKKEKSADESACIGLDIIVISSEDEEQNENLKTSRKLKRRKNENLKNEKIEIQRKITKSTNLKNISIASHPRDQTSIVDFFKPKGDRNGVGYFETFQSSARADGDAEIVVSDFVDTIMEETELFLGRKKSNQGISTDDSLNLNMSNGRQLDGIIDLSTDLGENLNDESLLLSSNKHVASQMDKREPSADSSLENFFLQKKTVLKRRKLSDRVLRSSNVAMHKKAVDSEKVLGRKQVPARRQRNKLSNLETTEEQISMCKSKENREQLQSQKSDDSDIVLKPVGKAIYRPEFLKSSQEEETEKLFPSDVDKCAVIPEAEEKPSWHSKFVRKDKQNEVTCDTIDLTDLHPPTPVPSKSLNVASKSLTKVRQEALQSTSALKGRNSMATVKKQKRSNVICPAYKIVEGTSFAVDAFRFGDITGVTHYFLTHFHADHYIGLKKSFNKPLYCSEITAKLVKCFFNINEQYVHIIDLDVPFNINDIEVTAIDANHCPGAVMFLFKLSNGERILHTGDFRASPEMESSPVFWNNKIDTVYLDTTYLSSKYAFKSQSESILDVISAIEDFQYKHIGHRILYICGSYVIGKEKLWVKMAEEFNLKVWTDGSRRKALNAIADPEMIKHLVGSPNEASLHILTINQVRYDYLIEYLRCHSDFYDILLAIRPSGWEKNSKPQFRGKINIIGVEYSEHSSYEELRRFIRFLIPKKVISTVPYGGDLSCTPNVPIKWLENNLRSWTKGYQTSITNFVRVHKTSIHKNSTSNYNSTLSHYSMIDEIEKAKNLNVYEYETNSGPVTDWMS